MSSSHVSGGRFDFGDGGTYAGGWLEGRAQGHGVCTGPKGEGAYCGAWQDGFETCGVYAWGASQFEGQWLEGKRHGFGTEAKGRWVYRGEWTDGLKGRYGSRQCVASAAKYDGTWAGGLQDGYGSETYADGGSFQGQWVKGMRHGYGVRSSAPFGLAAHTRRESLRKSPTPGSDVTTLDRRPEAGRGGFVLRDNRGVYLGRGAITPDGPAPSGKRSPFKGLLSRTPKVRTSYEGDVPANDDGSATDSFDVDEKDPIDGNVIETYMGEWKGDRRSGFGIAERSDGLKYEGEWHNNRRFGYGRTTYKDGAVERGKYRNNVLVGGGEKKAGLFRSPKFKERVEAAVGGAHRASQIALQKADIAISRTATARGKAEQADVVAKQARADAEIAKRVARNFAPEFQLPSETKGFLKPKFPSGRESAELPDDNKIPDFSKPDLDGSHFLSPDPQPSAFLGLFSNNPDRRPSNAGLLLRRPSAVHLRRPSVVVEHSIAPHYLQELHKESVHSRDSYAPSAYQQKLSQDSSVYNHNYHQNPSVYPPKQSVFSQDSPAYSQKQSVYSQDSSVYPQKQSVHSQDSSFYNHNLQDYHQNPSVYPQKQSVYSQDSSVYHQNPYPPQDQYYHNPYYQQQQRHYQQPLTLEQVTTDHLHFYYDRPPPEKKKKNLPAVDLTELSALYGIPIRRPLMDEDTDEVLGAGGRRQTLPTLIDDPGVVRSGSLYGGTKKPAAEAGVAATAGAERGGRKNSLPDIGSAGFAEPRVLTREAIALLSSQRREAMRREEEEALRLRANPLLYLVSPEVWDWFASQQLVIMIIVINVALGLIFFKVIL